jgi:hypothetical protein
VELPKNEEELKAAIAEASKGLRAELTEERTKRAEFEKQLKAIQTDLDKAKAAEASAAADKEKAALEGKGEYDKALKKVEETYTKKFNDLNDAVKARDSKIEELLIDGKILALAENAINPSQAVVLMKATHQFIVKEGQVIVNTPDGKPMLDDKGQAVTVEGAYSKFMGENLHLVKPGSAVGGPGTHIGATALNRGAGDIDAQIADAIKRGDKHEIIKLKARKQSSQGPHELLKTEQLKIRGA